MDSNFSSSNDRNNLNWGLYTPEALDLKCKNDAKKAGLDGFDVSKLVPTEVKGKKGKKSKKGEENEDTSESAAHGGSTSSTPEGGTVSPSPGETGSDFPFSYGGTS